MKYVFNRCPRAYTKDRSFAMAWRYYLRYAERGALPESGGTAEQPAKLMHMIDIIDGEVGKLQHDQIEYQKKKNKRR